MKRRTSISILAGLGLVGAALILSGCTASFCTPVESARIMYTFDSGVTVYYDGNDSERPEGATQLEGYNNVYLLSDISNSKFLVKTLIPALNKSGIFIPSLEYFAKFDSYAREYAVEQVLNNETYLAHYQITAKSDITAEILNDILDFKSSNKGGIGEAASLPGFGYTRFLTAGSKDAKNLFDNYDNINKLIEEDVEAGRVDFTYPTTDFIKTYKSNLKNLIAQYRSCISTTNGYYGNYGTDSNTQVYMDTKTYGEAWGHGFFEGLLVYPISAMTDFFTLSMAGGTEAGLAAGWPQLLSIVFVTIIVRGIMLLITFPQTLSQAKMTALQPELAKLQQKYPNANTNQYEKQKMAQEQMALYKKNKVHPFLQIVVLILQFPIFICVWSALQGSAALSTGSFLNLNLSTTISQSLTNTTMLPGNATGWWTALVLFILMAAAQFFAIKVPQWIQKANERKVKKLNKSNTANQSQRTMKIIQYVMLVFIIFMGFSLPSAMGVYWLVSALFSMGQAAIVQLFVRNRKKGKK